MLDILHNPTPIDDELKEWKCSDCELDLPQPACMVAGGGQVLEIGGGLGFIPFDGTPGSVSCKHPSAQSQRKSAELIDSGELEVSEPELAPGEKKKEARPLSDIERMVNRRGLEGFLQLREISKPEGY